MTKKEKPVRIVPTIFAGRGAHLLLPRDRVLAVRCISSRGYRIRRLADLLGESAEEAAKRRDEADNEQRIYFRRAFGKKDTPPDEFDLVVNCDFIGGPQNAAVVVVAAFQANFTGERLRSVACTDGCYHSTGGRHG
jgi:hypothetical protein